jgi:hypothetical protein
MALEKTKQDKIVEPLSPKKTKRNRQKTECSVNRRAGCGICGSLNTASQGVAFCNVCGTESEFLHDNEWWFGNNIEVPCDCLNSRIDFKGKVREYRDIGQIKVGKCLVCGSVRGSFCPNGKKHDCWKSWDGKKFCRNCGYRR